MKILISPDSFKGSLSAKQVADLIEKGFRKVFIEADYLKVPVSDGGEGILQILINATNGKKYSEFVTDPLGNKIKAEYGISGDEKTAIIEMARASGLMLLPKEEHNPMKATTFGTGELIKAALNKGFRRFIVGIGGSATNDGGAGAVQALGVQLLDKKGEEIPVGGAGLGKLSRIDISKIDKRIFESEIIIACDVKNPLTGKKGATFVYAEQKGASRGEVKILEKNMIHFVDIIKKDLKINVEKIPGSGAAGGLGAGLMVFLKAKLEPGFEIVKRYTNLEEKINDANLVITGEGEMDFQTEFGKAPLEVAKIAKTRKIPVIAIVGNLNKISDKYDNYFKKIFSLTSNKISKIEAMRNAENYLIEISEEAARYWKKTHPSPLL